MNSRRLIQSPSRLAGDIPSPRAFAVVEVDDELIIARPFNGQLRGRCAPYASMTYSAARRDSSVRFGPRSTYSRKAKMAIRWPVRTLQQRPRRERNSGEVIGVRTPRYAVGTCAKASTSCNPAAVAIAARLRWTSTAQRTASTTLLNSASNRRRCSRQLARDDRPSWYRLVSTKRRR